MAVFGAEEYGQRKTGRADLSEELCGWPAGDAVEFIWYARDTAPLLAEASTVYLPSYHKGYWRGMW